MLRSHRLLGNQDNGNAERMCWICLNADEETPRTRARSDWLQPCRCRGINKWVHEACLSRWIDEKQLLNPDVPVSCPQCHTEYIIIIPPVCRFGQFLERVESTYDMICVTLLIATVAYFGLLSYGALTLHQMVGHERCMQLLKDNPALLMILLPSVPASLFVLYIRFDWDNWLVRWLRRRQNQPVPPEHLDEHGESLPGAPLSDAYFAQLEPIDGNDALQVILAHFQCERCRLCTALSLPTFAMLLGQTLYGNCNSKLLSFVMGAVTFEAIKGLLWVYLQQCQYYRRRYRIVLDYSPPENVERSHRSV